VAVAPEWAASPAFAEYLRAHVEGLEPPVSVKPFDGGQSNPTYRVTDAGGREWVLRKKPHGELLPSAHAVDREYRVMKALADTRVPVPRMCCYCDDPSVIGTPFYVMEFVRGRILWAPALPQLDARERASLYDDIGRVIASLHTIEPAKVGLEDYGRPVGFIARQVARWSKQYRASETEPIAAMDRLIEWLPKHIPENESCSIFHGDLRLDNFIVHPSEPRVVAVLDWELSTLGEPTADLAHYALVWRLTSTEFRGMAERSRLPAGIPSEKQLLQLYRERTAQRIDPKNYEFCVAYAMFRLAAILQGIAKRARDGTASNAKALETGQKAQGIADAAWRSVQLHFDDAR
jgi:aminoglycoside phosphotransferase (APT) family kinase protein